MATGFGGVVMLHCEDTCNLQITHRIFHAGDKLRVAFFTRLKTGGGAF